MQEEQPPKGAAQSGNGKWAVIAIAVLALVIALGRAYIFKTEYSGPGAATRPVDP